MPPTKVRATVTTLHDREDAPNGTRPGSAPARGRVLFLDKVLLEPFAEEPRGVEVFNLNLIRDLTGLGHDLTVAVDPSWRGPADRWLAGRRVTFVSPPLKAGKVFGPLSLLTEFSGQRYPVLLLGNVANRLVPLLLLLRGARCAERCVLITHRVPSWRCRQVQRLWPTDILCVNRRIASFFNPRHYASVAVRYGVTDHERFLPPERTGTRETVNFCVLGRLDNRWKGADTAVDAFRRQPADVRARCRLHLASYDRPPDFGDAGIRTYPWMPFASIPAFLRGMDAMIAPSRDENNVILETFCQAMVQGMLTGLPILANDLPVLTEKLDNGGGRVFRDAAGLAGLMADFARDRALRERLGAEARAVALDRYVWRTDRFSDDYLASRQRR